MQNSSSRSVHAHALHPPLPLAGRVSKAVRSRVFAVVLVLALSLQPFALALPARAYAVDGSTIMVFHPDFHSRLGAKILATITTPNAARLKMTLTSDTGYSATLADMPSPTAPDALVSTLNLRNMPHGTYTLDTRILDSAGTLLAEKTETFSRAIDGAPTVGIDENNNIVYKGQPFFVVNDYFGQFPNLSNELAANQINSTEVQEYNDLGYTPTTFASFLDKADTAGIAVIGPTRPDPTTTDIVPYINASKNKPGLLAWEWMDEPEYYPAGRLPASTVRGWTDITHANDPNHPVTDNLVGWLYTNHTSEFENNVAKEYTIDRLNAGLPLPMDIFSTDYYPVDYAPRLGLTLQASFDSYAEQLVNLRTWTKGLVPYKTFVETADGIETSSPAPTAQQVWAEVWIAIANGCKGISWFPFFGTILPEVPPVQTKAGQYIKTFGPQLAQPDSNKVSRTYLSGDRVDYITKEYNGKIYVFAVNRNVTTAANVRFDVSGLVPSSVNVYGESRTIAPSGSSFTDTFQPYAVHIYEISGSGGSSTAPTGTMSLDKGAVSTNSTTLTVDSAVTAATQMRIDAGSGYGAWMPYAASTVAQLAPGDGTKTVSVQYQNAAGTLTLSGTITLDTVAPAGTMTVDNGSAYATSTAATVGSSVTGATRMRIDPGTGVFGGWTAYAASSPIALPAGDGPKTVRAEYADAAGNVLALSDTITLDTVAPSGTMTVNNGSAYTTSTAAIVGSSVTGATRMRIDPGTGSFGGWTAYAPSAPIVLPFGDGPKTVRAEYADAAGNVLALSDTITLDTAPPSGTMAIAGGAPYTATTAVSVDSAVTGAARMRFDAGSGYGAWMPYAASTPLTLPSGDGVKSVTAQYQDAAGNSLTLSDTITLDAAAPSGTMTVNDGATVTTSTAASLDSNVSGATEMRVDPGTGTFGAWVSYTARQSITLPAANGMRDVRAEYRNAAGASLSLSDEILVDVLGPTAPTGLVASADRSVTLSWNAQSGAAGYRVYRSTASAGPYVRISASAPSTATTFVDSSVTRRTTYYYRVSAVDAYGVEGAQCAPVSATVKAKVVRIAGADRYQTAVAMSEATFASADTVVLATGERFPDALAASSLAGSYDAPLLLTRAGALPASTADEIARLKATHVILVGGTTAISSQVADTLSRSLAVERIAGADRYGTAALIARRVYERGGRGPALIVRGDGFADALAVSPIANALRAPVLYVGTDSIPAATRTLLAGLPLGEALVVGGPPSVSERVRASLPLPATRVAGATRYETALAVASLAVKNGWADWETIGVARGDEFPDGLVGGSALGRRKGVLLLTPTVSLPASVQQTFEAQRDVTQEVACLGQALSDSLLRQVSDSL